MGLDNLLATLEKRDYVTPVTSEKTHDVTPKAPPILACTPVTPVTLENDVTGDEAAILAELRRDKVLAMLGDGRKYAVFVENPDADPVICAVAIRGLASFELEIPRHSYDGLALLELIEQHTIEKEKK